MSDEEVPTLLTIPEAARRLGIHRQALYEARDRGEIDVYRLAGRWQRVSVEEIKQWVASKKLGG